MVGANKLEALLPDHIFDGGDLDCGSGLALLIRQHMLQVPVDGVLEVRSSDPTVASDLPPWCKLTGHTYLGLLPAPKFTRYFVRRGAVASDDARQLQADQARAHAYEWRVRTRVTGHLKNTVYCRNFAFDVGQPASFDVRDPFPSAVEYLLGALSAALSAGFAGEASRAGLEVDDIEITARGQLENALAWIGAGGDAEPAFSRIEVKCFASSLADESALRAAWERAVQRSPIAATLRRAVDLSIKFAVV
jgi:hypothetical protein